MTLPITLEHPFRAAVPDDARLLAECVNYAGEGMPLYLWGKLARPPQTAWDIGEARARRKEGSFSYCNAIVIERDNEAAGCLIGYDILDVPNPVPADMPAMFRPLQELEGRAPGTWYVNVVAVTPTFRNAGLGAKLMALAERIAQYRGKRGLSLVVSDANGNARRLYHRLGYRDTAQLPIVKDDWDHDGKCWILMTKRF
jgi:ribosomal protein S18 acetylase RimI-like enzyme